MDLTRVLYLQGGSERAGGERMLFNLLRYLDRGMYEPIVAFLSEGPFVEEVAGLGVSVVQVGMTPRLRQIWRWLPIRYRIERLLAETGASLLHCNGEKTSVLGGRAAYRMAVPSIAWLHDAPGAGGLPGTLAQMVLARTPSTAVITCSQWLATEFNRRHRLGAAAIINGLDLDLLPSSGNALNELKATLGWPNGSLVIGHFTRLQRWKGPDVFIEAAKKISDIHPGARFLVVGGALFDREREYAAGLRLNADRLGLAGTLHFTGYRKDALELMSDCDVVVHCSRRPDPFPTVVLEAMALGKPVVATRTRGPEEAITDGQDGVLVQPDNVRELSDAILRLIRSDELRRSLGGSAYKVARDKYDARRMTREFEALYSQLAPNAAGMRVGP